MLLDRDAADDVAQEVLISVMGSIGSYRGTGKVASWLHTIVKRRVADHLRAHRESRRLRGSRVLLHRTFTSAREGFLPHDDSSHPHHRPGRWRRSRRRRGRAGHPGRRDHLDLRGRGGGGLRHRPAGSRSASQRHTRTEHLGHGTVEHRESIAVRAGGDGQVEQLPVGLRVGHVQPVLALLCPPPRARARRRLSHPRPRGPRRGWCAPRRPRTGSPMPIRRQRFFAGDHEVVASAPSKGAGSIRSAIASSPPPPPLPLAISTQRPGGAVVSRTTRVVASWTWWETGAMPSLMPSRVERPSRAISDSGVLTVVSSIGPGTAA